MVEKEKKGNDVSADVSSGHIVNKQLVISKDIEQILQQEVEREIKARDRTRIEEELRLWLERQEMVKEDLLSLLQEVVAEKKDVKMEGPEDKREKLRKKIKEFDSKGYDTSSLKSIIDTADIDTLWNAFVSYMDGIEMIEEAKAIIKTLPRDVFQIEIAAIENKMNDPTKGEEILKIAKLLKKKSDWRYRSEDTVRMVLETKYKDWKSKGYNVDVLEKVLKEESDIGIIESTFREYEDGIKRIETLRHELESIENVRAMEDEYAAIVALMNDPTNVKTIEDLIKELKVKSRKEKKRDEYRKKMEAWREEGYIVDRLEAVINEDMNRVMKAFFEFERDLETLRSFESKVDALAAKGADERAIQEIYTMLNDPSKIDKIRQKIKALEKSIRDAIESEVRPKVAVEDDMIGTRAGQESTVKVPLHGLEPAGTPDKVSTEETVEKGFELTEEKSLGEMSKRKTELLAELGKYEADGLNTEFIKALIDNGRFEEAEGWIQKIPDMKKEIKNMEDTLKAIDSKPLAPRITNLLTNLNDIENFEANKMEYKEIIDAHISEKEKKVIAIIEKMKSLIEKWEGMGIDTTNQRDMLSLFEDEFNGWRTGTRSLQELEGIVKGDLEIVWNEFKSLERQLDKIEALKSDLESMKGMGVDDRVSDLLDMLSDPDNISLVEDSIRELKAQLNTKTMGLQDKGTEIGTSGISKFAMERISVWESDGFDLSSLREVIPDMDEDEVKELLDDYEDRIVKAKKILRSLEDIASKNSKAKIDPRYNEIKAMVMNPDNLEVATELLNTFKNEYIAPTTPKAEGQEMDTDDIDSLLKKGNVAYRSGDYEVALNYYNRVLSIDPENKKAKFYKKRSEMAMKSQEGVKPKQKIVKRIRTEKARETKGPTIIPELEKIKPDPKCNVCNGTGKCASCKGTGKCYWCHGTGNCADCNGTGMVGTERCTSCNGTGTCDWCSGTKVCYWCKGTGKCDKCILPKARDRGIEIG